MPDSYTFDLDAKQWIESLENPEPRAFPEWGYGDNRSITVTFARRAGSSMVAETAIASAKIGIKATIAGSILTTAVSGTPSAAYAHPFTVNLTDSAIDTAIAAMSQEPGTFILEFRITGADGGINRYRTKVLLARQVNTDSNVPPAAPERSYSTSESDGLYVTKHIPPGMRLIFTDEGTGEKVGLYIANRQPIVELLG
jgi:hypothetical protein